MRVPSKENATDRIQPEWPSILLSSAPVEASHTCIDVLIEPETMRVSSLENATEEKCRPQIVRSGKLPSPLVCKAGIWENCFFHIRDKLESRDHVANDDM